MSNPVYRLTILQIFLFGFSLLQSQSDGYYFWRLSTKEGLFSESNLGIGQGPDGYIWLTSGNRLQRYDGLEFKTYYFEADSFFNAQTKRFQLRLVDRDNRVWCITDTAVYRFTPATHTWKRFSVCSALPDAKTQIGGFYSTTMLQDRRGKIWMNNGTVGLLLLDEQKVCFVPPPVKNPLPPDYGTGLAEDSDGFLWFTYKNRLCCFDPHTNTFWHAGYNPENHPAIGLPGQSLFLDSHDHIWLSGWQPFCPRLIRVHRKTGHIRTFPVHGVSCFAEDRQGHIWMGRYYDKNLYYYDPDKDTIQIYPSEWWRTNALHVDEHIADLFMDKQQNLWALDWYKVNVFRPDRQQFFVFRQDPARKGLQLPHHEVNHFLQASNGTVYVSYWHDKGGVAVLDSNLNLKKIWGWSDSSIIFPRWCWTLLEDRQGRIWINQQNGYLTIYDPLTGKSRKSRPPEFQGSSPQCAIRDSENDLWFGLWRQKGLVRWNSREQRFYHYPIHSDKNWELVTAILEDRNGRDLWLGTFWGLFLFDKQTGKITGQYQPVAGKSTAYQSFIKGIAYLDHATLVLGTGEGLYTFDTRLKKGNPLLTHAGKTTASNEGAIHLDVKGNIWFSYKGGVARYNLKTRQVSHYGSEDWVDIITYGGLHANTFRDGRLFVGIKNHFAVFHPDSLPEAGPPPAPRITRLWLHNRDLPEALWRHDLELRHDSNFITFHFSTLRLFEPAVQFRYRLLGLHEAWSEMQPEHIARYTSLPPGYYEFQVQATNREGMEGPVTSLTFRIRPPWYATWWFRSLLALAFIALVYAVFRYREFQRLQQEKLRLRIARDLHDEMGSTLSSISILSEAALRNLQQDIDRARFGAIGERARQVMEAMSDIVWSVNPRNDSMANVLQRMKQFAVEILEPQGIALHFEADEAVATLNLPMEQRKDFYLLFKEAVNNAAKYSGARDVWVRVQAGNGGLTLEVRDNGRGFDVEQVKRGNELWNMERRAERMGGRFELESRVGEGTWVLVQV